MLEDQSYSGIEKVVNSINASGGTNFSNAFEKISATLSDRSKVKVPLDMSEVVVIFFTDGQDVESQLKRKTSMVALKQELEKFTSTVHTIGFSAGHDAVLLSEITTLGTTQGSFQYVKESKEIVTAVQSIAQLVSSAGKKVAAKVIIGKEEQKLFLNSSFNGYTGTIYIPRSTIVGTALKLIISSGKTTQETTLEPKEEEQSVSSTLRLTCEYITQRVIELSRTSFDRSASKDQLIQTKNEITLFEQVITEAGQKIPKIRNREQRKEMFSYIEEASLLISEFHKMLSSAMAQTLVSNDKIATLNSMAYKVSNV
jgi:hypothetical protein